MMRHLSSLTVLSMTLAVAACAVPSAALADSAESKAAIVFGSCPQKPAWPEAALREKRQGSVALLFEVDADNTVLDSKVKGSSGHADLDEAARVGLAKCRFKAATRNGMPVRGWAQLTYKWTLE